jgi:hypothetical protein
MDDMDPDGSCDQQPPSHNFIHTFTAIGPPDAKAPASSLSSRSF